MNLLLVNYEYPPIGGGAANATQCLARAMHALGHHVEVLTSALRNAEGTTNEAGVIIHRLPVGRAHADRATMRQMALFLWRSRTVAIRLHESRKFEGTIAFFTIPSGPAALKLSNQVGVPYVVSLRGSDVPGHEPGLELMHLITGLLRRSVLRNARAIVANSEALAAASRAKDPFSVSVIANGVDCELYHPAPELSHGKCYRLIFVGRVHPGKNLGSVVEQLPAFQQIELVVVGDGEQRLDLSNRAETLGVADRIRWLGWQSKENLPQLYREADALVHPSLYEGSPNVVLEAMASGIPTVASDTPGNRSVVRDGENGLLYSLSDPLGLRNALVRLTTDRELALQLGANGRRLALAHHSWTRAAQSYLEYFSQS